MKLKLELTKREIEALQYMASEAEINATVMLDGGKEGGQLKDAKQIIFGIATLDKIIELASRGQA